MLYAEIFTGSFGVALATLLGLVVGSFLNVVIYRLPVMMEREEKLLAWQVLHGEDQKHPDIPDAKFNLLYPPSHCPQCKHSIRAWENIPVVSYLIQKGRCKGCNMKISPRYIGVEILTAIASFLVAIHFETSAQVFFALLFTWTLISLTFIDAQTSLLPDVLTLPLMWLGIFCALLNHGSGLYVSLAYSVSGAMIGYLFLWLIFWIFKLVTGKEGMGYGDFKLLAALCAWQGAMYLPAILVIACVLGLIYALTVAKISWGKAMPFGPYLALAGWITFVYGENFSFLMGIK